MEGGTGRWIQIPGIPSAGKTGTAQNNRGDDDSVFIMFAPYDEPRIALGVMVENAGFGSTTAGPIASLLAERYLTKRIAPERRPLFERTLAVTSGPLPE
jgi:penicillin-binding protein 2